MKKRSRRLRRSARGRSRHRGDETPVRKIRLAWPRIGPRARRGRHRRGPRWRLSADRPGLAAEDARGPRALSQPRLSRNCALPRGAHSRRGLLRTHALAGADSLDQARSGALVLERDREDPAAAGEHVGRARDALHRPVAALHQDFGPVVVEPCDGIHRVERGDDGEPVFERVDGPLGALAQPPGGRIAVQRHEQRRAQLARAREVGHMAAMQDIEHAVGEHQRPAELTGPAREVLGRTDLAFEGGRLHFAGQTPSPALHRSKIRTTLITPPVLRATSTASAASCSVTMPIRYTTPASVTTFTWIGLTLLASRSRPFTLVVM